MNIQPGLVSVVIINFNSAKHIERCVDTIQAQNYSQVEILVVDNGSTDGSLQLVRRMAQEGRLRLYEGSNVGSSKANNHGIRESCGEFVLVLNADAFPAVDYIAKCVAGFRSDDAVGTAIGKLVSESDNSILDSAGLYFFREGLAVDRGFGEKDHGQYDAQEFVDGACCAAAMYRRTMLEDIRIGEEYYDEDFFAFAEDAELSLHSGIRGWKTLYIPSAIVLHVRGGSSSKLSEFTYYLNERNVHLLLRKSFVLVARPSDRVLQYFVLLGRRITEFRHLSADSRRKLRREIAEMKAKMDLKRNLLRNPKRAPAFDMVGRRSYLFGAVMRKLKIFGS